MTFDIWYDIGSYFQHKSGKNSCEKTTWIWWVLDFASFAIKACSKRFKQVWKWYSVSFNILTSETFLLQILDEWEYIFPHVIIFLYHWSIIKLKHLKASICNVTQLMDSITKFCHKDKLLTNENLVDKFECDFPGNLP